MKGYSAQQIRDAEAPHLAAGEPLMQRAASGLAAEISRMLDGIPVTSPVTVVLLVGTGNNGADAMYAGAELATQGAGVTIVPTGERMHDGALAAALNAGAQLVGADQARTAASGADVIVDGILGTGTSASPALRGDARAIVATVLSVLKTDARPLVVAVDVPSGIDPNNGSVPDPLVLPADVTVTFGGYKAGLLLPPASALAGEIRLIDIGLGPDLDALEPLVVVDELT